MAKQLLFTALLVSTLASTVVAQGMDFTRFKFGLQLSPSISWMTTDDARLDGNGTNLGLKLATQAEFFFAENYAIETGLGFHFNTGGTLLSANGGRFFTESIPSGDPYAEVVGANTSLKYSLQYVEIPLALKLRTREFGYLSYYLEAPIFTLGIRSNAMGSLSGGGISQASEEIGIKPEVSPLTLAWGFGGGVEYAVAESTRLFGGLQFSRVFTDVTKDKDYVYTGRTASGDPKAGINSITLRLGVLF